MTGIADCVSVTSVLVVGVVSLLAYYTWRSMQAMRTFARLGIPGPRALPFVGNTLSMTRKGFANAATEWGKQYGKVYGICFPGPALVVGDVEMLREVFVKRFHQFANRMPDPSLGWEPWDTTLPCLRDDHWKHVRGQLSSTLSSGKLKRMMPVIERVAKNFVSYIQKLAENGEIVELKELCTSFATDSVAGAAFGIDVNTLQDPDDPFIKNSQKILNQNLWLFPIVLIFPFMAKLLHRLFSLDVIDYKATSYLLAVLDQALKDRRQDTKSYKDFLQLLVDAEKEGEMQGPVDAEIDHSDHLATSQSWKKKGLSDEEIKANALLFLLAGLDTVSTVMSFTFFMLAANPDSLRKALEEIDDKLGQSDVTYDRAMELTYLEMCINETMRMYPPGFMLDRETKEDTELGGYSVKKGMRVLVPAWVIHMDPEYWPEPDKFDPERHTPAARATRHPFTFMPFGMGPRNCIGMRLALLEMRVAMATVLQNYTPVLCEKSVYPPKMKPPQLQMIAADGLWVKFTKRE